MPQPSVSVIIPAYNAAPYIEETLRSVIEQTHQNTEIIVVDDGSRDNTADLVGCFPTVRCIKQANAGVSQARNRGVSASTGDFIAFLDADDAWHPDKLRQQLLAMAAYPECDLVRTGLQETPFESHAADESAAAAPHLVAHRRIDDLATSILHPYFATSSVMVRRGAFDRAKGFDTTLPYAEDVDFYLKVLADRPQVIALTPPMVFKRTVTGSLGDDSAAGYEKLIDVHHRFLRERPDVAQRLGAPMVRRIHQNLLLRHARSLGWEGRRLASARKALSALSYGANLEVLAVLARSVLPRLSTLRGILGHG